MISTFHVIDDKNVILRSNGVYRQVKAYRRDGAVYAGHGSGFVKLLKKPGTSNPNISWDETDVEITLDSLGRPVLAGYNGK